MYISNVNPLAQLWTCQMWWDFIDWKWSEVKKGRKIYIKLNWHIGQTSWMLIEFMLNGCISFNRWIKALTKKAVLVIFLWKPSLYGIWSWELFLDYIAHYMTGPVCSEKIENRNSEILRRKMFLFVLYTIGSHYQLNVIPVQSLVWN